MCALACTITHVATQQLFVYYDDGALDKPFSKQRLKCWLCEGISHACELTDLDPWSHLSALYPFLEVLFSKASVEDPCLKSVSCLAFDVLLFVWMDNLLIDWLIDADHLLVLSGYIFLLGLSLKPGCSVLPLPFLFLYFTTTLCYYHVIVFSHCCFYLLFAVILNRMCPYIHAHI